MEFTHAITILLAGASLCLGAIFGTLRSKIFASKTRTGLHYFFNVFSAIVIMSSGVFLIVYWHEISKPNVFAISVLILAVISSIGLLVFTQKFLRVKDVYHTSELDKIVNDFTSGADKKDIKLFGGDLNFFGNTPSDMDSNLQYTILRSLQFNKISILCEIPNDGSKKIRYGKILHDMPNTDLRFYNPEEADLSVRGRMITVNGVDKLLMYNKIKSKHYQAIETDSANSGGALYINIWKLVWSLATLPDAAQIQEYKKLFTGR